jgi:hypothetical protein
MPRLTPPNRGPRRGPVRDPLRETGSGRVQVLGRDGEVLTRKRNQTTDPFHVPEEWKPDGWEYEWKAYSVYEQVQQSHMNNMQENAFRPVPASRYPGKFMANGYEGPILRDGLMLMERPVPLGEEARAEEITKATRQMQNQREALQLSRQGPLHQGISEDGSRYAGAGAQVRQEIAPELEVAQPVHQVVEEGEEP